MLKDKGIQRSLQNLDRALNPATFADLSIGVGRIVLWALSVAALIKYLL